MNSQDVSQGQIQETTQTPTPTSESDPNSDLIGYEYRGRVHFKVTGTMPGNEQYVLIDQINDEDDTVVLSSRVAAHVRALKMALPDG
jgi:hypothetical protein